MTCKKRGFHFTTDCDSASQPLNPGDNGRKPKKLRSGLLNTRARDAPAAQRAIMHRNSSLSPLLRLPPELRNKIYGFILGAHHLWIGYIPHQHKIKTIKNQRYRVHVGGGLFHRLEGHGRCHSGSQRALSLHLGLLRVCRQIYGETALLPYVMNVFVFENDWVRRRCFKTLRPTQKRAMARFLVEDEGW